MITSEQLGITQSAEYRTYIAALCRLASQYVPEIRQQYAARAYEIFQNESVRRLVLAYGEELERLEESRQREFLWASEPGRETTYSLEDTCLNNASHYGAAIRFFFEIQ